MSFVSRIDTGEAEVVIGPIIKTTAAVSLLLFVAACSGQGTQPQSLPPQSVSKLTLDDSEFEEYVVTQEGEPAAELPPSTADVDEADAPVGGSVVMVDELEVVQDDTLVVIEDGTVETSETEMTLAESARAERRRRNLAPPAQIVITDKNLADYATGELTSWEGPGAASSPESLGADEGEEDLALDETYWRDRGYEIRLAWKEATERVGELEGDIFNLRMRFYAEDDPFYRDSQIKPAWDHAIEELRETREEVELRQQELKDFLEEGRVAGALPGWLREGIELEPEPPVEEEMTISEPGEPESMGAVIGDPPIASDPGGGGS
jgi:hypothetical protein